MGRDRCLYFVGSVAELRVKRTGEIEEHERKAQNETGHGWVAREHLRTF
jgi:hypothetical protein